MAEEEEDQAYENLFGSGSESDGERQPGFVKEAEQAAARLQPRAPQRDDDGDEEQSDQADEQRAPRQTREEQLRAKRTGPPLDISAQLMPIPAHVMLHRLQLGLIDIEPNPFDPETFEEEEEITVDAHGNRKVRLRDSAVIRWRYVRGPDGEHVMGPDGMPQVESNAKMVRWSDGSLQMVLGDEVLDVTIRADDHKQDYLFCISGVLQGQAPLTSNLGFRPARVGSKLHKRLREEVDKRNVKLQKVVKTAEMNDPVRESQRREKMYDETYNLTVKQDKAMRRAIGRPSSAFGRSRPRSQLNTRFLANEADDDFIDDDDHGGGRRMYDEDAEREAARRLQSAKHSAPPPASTSGRAGQRPSRRAVEDDEEEEELMPEEDEEEYVDSQDEGASEGEEDEDEGARPSRGGRDREGAPGKGKGLPPAVKSRVRRGVVLSDDEDQ